MFTKLDCWCGVGKREDQGREHGKELYERLNLTLPEEGFELYRHKNAEEMTTQGWSGLSWARKNTAGDYEIRAVTREGEGYSVTGGIFPKEGFEEHYEKTSL